MSLNNNYLCKVLFYIFLTETALALLNASEAGHSEEIISKTTATVTSEETNTTLVNDSIKATPKPDSRYAENFSGVPKHCSDLRDPEHINFSNHQLNNLSVGIFDSCLKAIKINLSYNYLSTLPENIFILNTYLEKLDVSHNTLVSVNPNWFQGCANRLRRLDLSNNRLKHFPIERFPKMTHLKKVLLDHNRLIDLDEVLFVERFDTLRHLHFQHNQIGCTRQLELITFFKDKGMNKSTHNTSGCINDGVWAAMKMIEIGDTFKEKFEKPSIHYYILYGLVLIIVFAFIFLSIWFKQKLNSRINRRLGTDWGEYYQSEHLNELSTPQVTTSDAQIDESLTVGNTYENVSGLTDLGPAGYATVDKNRTKD